MYFTYRYTFSNMVRKERKNKKWYYQNKIQYTQDRASVLLTLRYQSAFIIITILIGIWTVLGAIASQTIKENTHNPDFTVFILWGCILSVIILTIWRIIVHYITMEENSYLISQVRYEQKIGIFEEKEGDLYNQIKVTLNLGASNKFKNLCPDHKIDVMDLLQEYLNSGLIFFDKITTGIIAILVILGTIFYCFAPDQTKSLLISVHWLGMVLYIISTVCILVLYFWHIHPITPFNQRNKTAIDELYKKCHAISQELPEKKR